MEAKFDIQALAVSSLKKRMILAEDLYSLNSGKKILAKGHELTTTLLEHLTKYQDLFGLKEPIKVLVPLYVESV